MIVIIIIIIYLFIYLFVYLFIYLFIVGSNSSIKANKNQVTNKIFQIPMLNRIHIAYLEGYSEPCQISKKEIFT